MTIEARAFARAGLLGNPSDGYFGKTISIIVRNFSARVFIAESPAIRIEGGAAERSAFPSLADLADQVGRHGYYGGERLIKAAAKVFHDWCRGRGIALPARNFAVRFETTIPRQVGLAGSSAIVTAAMRALARFFDVEIPLEVLPSLILAAERDELGINAGLQDRVIQVFEGCMYMDFDAGLMKSRGFGQYERIEPGLLPSLYIAYRPDLAKVSGQALSDIRVRWERGEREVVETLAEIADLAARGREALLAGRPEELFGLMNRNFDLRCRIMNVSAQNREMIEAARSCGASAKFAGSGGSAVGIFKGREMLDRLVAAMEKIGGRVVLPEVA